jgi:hypothetical protein
VNPDKLAAIRERRDLWHTCRVHSGGIVGARDDIADLLDHVAELERELVKCRVIISTHRDSPTLVGANVALRATIARQRRAIYRLAARVDVLRGARALRA